MKFGPLGVWEILLILVVILLIFGPRRLPEMAKGIGQSVREFRKGIRDMKDDIDRDEPKKATVVETSASATPASVSASEAEKTRVNTETPAAKEAAPQEEVKSA